MIIDDDLDDPSLLLEQFAGQSPDVFWMMTADWEQLLFINESYEDLYGRSAETLAEDSLDFLNGVHPDFHEMVKRDMRVLAQGHPIDHEYRVNPGEDYERWAWATGRPVYEDGELTRLAGFVRDITDRKRRQAAIEERERTIREIYDVTSDSEPSFEEQVRRLLEIGCGILGTAFGTLSRIDGDEYEFQVVHPPGTIDEGSVTPLLETNCERTVAREETIVLGDIGEDAPDLAARVGNRDRGIETYLGAPVFVGGDEIHGTFCFYDETPRDDGYSEWETTLVDLMAQWVSYELTHRRARRDLERRNDQLEELSKVVAHDLRNPISVLSGYLEIAADTGKDEHYERCLDAVERMDSIVDDVLALARAGAEVEATESVDLAAAASSCWEMVDSGDASIDIDVAGTVTADEGQLRRLLENLFRNAVEHGGHDVSVTVGDLPNGFYVEDDGPGIPADERDRVFEAGFTTTSEGSGYGLRIVERVAEAHGWRITVEESSAGGARFEVVTG